MLNRAIAGSDFGLADAFEAHLAAEHGHGFKERRRVFASADGDADGLKHWPGFETKLSGGRAQRLVERIVIESGCGENLLRGLEDAEGESGIAALRRDQLGRVVGRELGGRRSRRRRRRRSGA